MIPTTTIVRIMTVAKTGRLTEMDASHCMAPSLHPRAVAHLGGHVGHDLVARLEAAHDGNEPGARAVDLDEVILEAAVDHHEDVAQRPLGPYGRLGHRGQR